MRITGVKTFLKVSPAILALFAVSLASQQAGQSKLPQSAKPVGPPVAHAPLSRACVPPPGFDPFTAENLLQNWSFDRYTGHTEFTGVGYGGNSAAPSWFVFNQTHATTQTQGAESFWGGPVLIVETTGGGCGIGQKVVGIVDPSVKWVVAASISVYSGKVCIGVGNGPNASCVASRGPTGGQGIPSSFRGCTSMASGTEFRIYSFGGPASFTVHAASVRRIGLLQ